LGRVRIIDRDFIEEHNLQRQVLFDEEDIKNRLPKAVAAERHLRKANSNVEVEGIVADVNFINIERFCQGADVILDGLDNAATRFLINDVSLKHGIPWVYGGALATTGMTMTIVPGLTPCLRCIGASMADPANAPTCETAGILGPVPAIIGAIQAAEAMKLLIDPDQINRDLLMVDIWRTSFDRLRLERREDCPACHGRYEYLEEKFDVRVTSLCGQSRSMQVLDTRLTAVDMDGLAARLKGAGRVVRDEFNLTLGVDDKEIIVFPDGRTIIHGTLDEAEARDLYMRYVAANVR
jgi:molybdopterin/thiamine biosynthesis adenylyltransferase